MYGNWYIVSIGSYKESLTDAEEARKLQPSYIKAVEKGKLK